MGLRRLGAPNSDLWEAGSHGPTAIFGRTLLGSGWLGMSHEEKVILEFRGINQSYCLDGPELLEHLWHRQQKFPFKC